MKKILLGTTAVIALGAISTEAFAADKIALGLGGFMRHYVGLINHDEVSPTSGGQAETIGLAQWSNTEVYFKGNTTLDSGIKVAVTVQLEGDRNTTADRRIDETFVALSSDAMGELKVGATLAHADGMIVRAPAASNFDYGDFDMGRVSTSTSAANNATTFATSSVDMTDMGGREAKFSYLSPSFSGVQVYASYTAAEGTEVSNGRGLKNDANANTANDGTTVGVAYDGELSGASVGADLTHYRKNGTNNVTHVGLNVGMAGFTIGGGYSDFSDDTSTATVANQSTNDGNAWELGVGYETGPYALSARYMRAESTGTTTTAGDNKDTAWAIDAAYDLGAGVNLAASYFNRKADPEGTGTTRATGLSTTVSGVIAGIEVGF